MNKVYLSPSGQEGNTYSYGNTNEREQCTKIALACQAALARCGIQAYCEPEVDFYQRMRNADMNNVDLYVPIHTNAFDGKVTGTRMFYYSIFSKGKRACECIFPYLDAVCPGTSSNIKANPKLIELKTPKAPGAYCECDFHDVPDVAEFIIEHTMDIGEAIAHGICEYFGVNYIPEKVEDIRYKVQVGSFVTRTNAESLRDKLIEKGYSAYIVTTDMATGK